MSTSNDVLITLDDEIAKLKQKAIKCKFCILDQVAANIKTEIAKSIQKVNDDVYSPGHEPDWTNGRFKIVINLGKKNHDNWALIESAFICTEDLSLLGAQKPKGAMICEVIRRVNEDMIDKASIGFSRYFHHVSNENHFLHFVVQLPGFQDLENIYKTTSTKL